MAGRRSANRNARKSRAPTLRIEQSIRGIVCGVDEVGYSPIAGPVVAAAVILPEGNRPRSLNGLRESKQMSAEERARFAERVRAVADVGLGIASVQEIDELNIYQANRLALARAIQNLDATPDVALVDGHFKPVVDCEVRGIVRGDEQSLSIAAASVVAKHWRDDLMTGLASGHPGFGWPENAGYGTEAHCLGILRFGPNEWHRRSFGPLRDWLAEGGVPEIDFRPCDAFTGRPETIQVKQNLAVVIDRNNRFLGTLLKTGRTPPWTVRAARFTDTLAYGVGPLREWHGERVSEPTAAALSGLMV